VVRAALLAISIAALGWLAACGYLPLYGTPRYEILPHLASIKINPIPDREGQQLRNMLYERLTPKGEPARPEYILDVGLSVSKQLLGLQRDDTFTRANIIVNGSYVLRAAADGRALTSGRGRFITSYDVLPSEFATVSAEADAERRALTHLGDDIAMKLSFYFTRLERERERVQ
jgi:LPS-assembly lipoprotein